MSWNDTRVATLKELCGQPLSASDIASELNRMCNTSFSRNAIIGKALRLGISLPHAGSHRLGGPQGPRATPSRPPRPPRADRQSASRIRTKVVRFRCEPAETDEGAPIDGGVTFDALTRDCCRWPFGDPATPGLRYCGQKRQEGVNYWFCAFHLKRAWSRSAAA